MRVLLVGRSAMIGGGPTFRFNIGRGLMERGHTVIVASGGGPMVQRYRDAGIEYYWAPQYNVLSRRVAGIIRRVRPDIVHAGNTTPGDVVWLACQETGTPFVVSLHNTITRQEASHECLKHARRIIVFDAGAAASAAKFTELFDTSRIVRAYRPVEHRPHRHDEISPEHVAYVARLSSRKGQVGLSLIDGFSAAARERPNACLTVIGGGSMHRQVTTHAARAAAEAGCKIQVLRPTANPYPHLKGVGVLVGAGYAALEALMQGRAVIGAGFKGYGPVAAGSVTEAVDCNFGDTVGQWQMTPENFRDALGSLWSAWETPASREEHWGLDRIAALQHGIPAAAERIEAIYREALAA